MTSSNPIAGTTEPRQVTRLATIAIVGIAYFVVAVVTLHFLRPDYDPVKQHLSGYVAGPYGFLMTSAFFALALGSLVLDIGLWQGVSRTNLSKVGLMLLAVFGVGVALEGIFPTDAEGAPQTTSGTIHGVAFVLSSLSLLAALILVSRTFRRNEKWRSFARPAWSRPIEWCKSTSSC